MPGENVRKVLRPPALAAYIAESALRSSVSTSVPCSGASASPRLGVTERAAPATWKGSAKLARTR